MKRSNDIRMRREAWEDAFEIAGRLAQDFVPVTVSAASFGMNGWPSIEVLSQYHGSIEVTLTAIPSYELATEDGETPWHWQMTWRGGDSRGRYLDPWQSTRTTARDLHRTLNEVTA